jgi:hypothetical protein
MRFLPGALLALAVCAPAAAQSVPELLARYSGRAAFDAATGTLRFQTSGRVGFGAGGPDGSIWRVPPEVRRIVIAGGARVEAAFTAESSLDIAGEGRSSEIFGTLQPALLHSLGLDRGGGCMPYSAVYARGRGVVVGVSRLTSRDPIGFHFTGADGAVLHLDDVAAIDDRGGFSNHSDGIQAGKGSTVSRSFFSTGDDVIKVYNDITVEDTTIEMIANAVPIQLGWGSYGDGAVGRFRNLTITGDSGRNKTHPVIEAHAGAYRKQLLFEGLKIENRTASLFNVPDPSSQVAVRADGADIDVARYADALAGPGPRLICGREDAAAAFHCP